MKQIENSHKTVMTALLLGMAALLTNGFVTRFGPSPTIAVGTVFLYMAAGSLPIAGTITACALGLMPYFFFTGEQMEGLRLLVVCMGISYVGALLPRFPSFLVNTIFWLVIFGPAFYYMGPAISAGAMLHERGVVFYALQDILLSLVSGAILLNSTVWAVLSHRPRHLSMQNLLIHVLTLVSAVMIFAVTLITAAPDASMSQWFDFQGQADLFFLLVGGILAPVFVAWRLARIIERDYRQLIPGNLIPHNQAGSFSGLSSDFWRRQSSTTIARPTELSEQNGTGQGKAKGVSDTFANASQGICALNRNGTISFVNRRFRTLTGITANEPFGKSFESVGMDPEICRHITELLEASFHFGPRVTELKINQLPDTLRFLEIASQKPDASQPSAIGDGPDSMIITIKDITDRRTVESHLLQSQKLRSLGDAIAEIGHMFNNSLTTITGYASFARHSGNKSDISDGLEKILESAKDASELVRRLLEFAEGKPTTMKVENLGLEISRRLPLLQHLVGDACEISLDSAAHPIGALCDSNLIMQALTNLVLNARESYGGRVGQISVTLDTEHFDQDVAYLNIGARAGDFARLRVRDNGVGMTSEVLARAFDPLFTTKTATGHSGLGLSIVFAIVRAHDGFLTAESHPEKGTTISVYLPLKEVSSRRSELPASTPAVSERRAEKLQAGINSPHILVVEDEPSIRNLVASMLTALGYTVTSCSNGYEALECNKSGSFDLILVDMVMPKMNGLELIDRVQSLKQEVKALIMTGYGVSAGRSDCGAEIIPKPFDLDTLARAVKKVLAGNPLQNRPEKQPEAALPE